MRHLLLTLALTASALSATAQDPLKTLPNNYKLILDNADLSVIRVHYGPHEKLPVHDHSTYPTVCVYLNDSGEVRLTHDETPPLIITRPPTKTGSFRIAPGRPERHSIENLSDLPSDFLRVELKHAHFNSDKPIRGAAPDLLTTSTTEEFKSPELTIRRIVCSLGPACRDNLSSPALVVALSPLSYSPTETKPTNPGSAERQMRIGDISWEPDAKSIAITAASPAPAQVLEITLPTPR